MPVAGDLSPAISSRSSSPLVPTVFHEPWWLDVVSAGTYRMAEFSAGGSCIGRLPYLLSRHRGLQIVGMPMLTHFLGPAIDPGPGKGTTQLLRTLSTAKDLIRQLPKAASVWFKLHRGTTDTLAFQALGYTAEVQFTSEVAPAPERELWAGLRDTTRRVIRRATDTLVAEETTDPDLFMHLYEQNLQERGLRNTYDSAICKQVLAEAVRRGAGRMLIATEGGTPKVGVFTIWDDSAAYYLLTTRSLESGNGGISLLIWEAIKHAAARGIIFDFDGLRPSGDIQFFAGFGGTLKPRYFVHRSSLAYRALDRLTRSLPAKEVARGL